MGTPFLAEIKILSFSFPPKGWAFCNGQTLPINQNQALFALMGTIYGGNGTTTFELPNLQSRIPMHFGNGHVQGESNGQQSHTLTLAELAAHSHPANCSNTLGTLASPSGNLWAADNNGNTPYSTSGGTTMTQSAIGPVGGEQPHNNLAPYLVLNFCIALVGIFPSQQ
jgi:microcystin-dependent protein